jgi:hypothetical protein
MIFEQPDVRPISDKLYRLVSHYTVIVHDGIGKEISIQVPAGYLTDLASIPQWVWSIFGLAHDGLYRGAAVVHDWLYGRKVQEQNYSELPEGYILTRKECDDIFKELIDASGESKWKEQAMYKAVRAFGWLYY